jgi:type I restriction enzyme S subunit
VTAASVWPTKALGEVVVILDSSRVPVKASERASRGGTIPYFGATGQTGTIDKALFDEPLVLLGEDGAPFFDPFKSKAYLIDGPAWVNNHVHVLRAGPLVNRKFLRYYLDQFDYRGHANGTTRLKLTQSAMKDIPVPMPDLDEQQRIVDILEDHLSRLDTAIDGMSTVERRARAMVTASAAHQVSAAGLNSPVVTVGQLALLVEYGSGAKTEVRDGSGFVPVLRMGNIKEGAIDWSTLKFLPTDHPDFPKLLLQTGDLLFNRTNSAEHVGKSAVFDAQSNASFASYLIRVRFDEKVLPQWANIVINSPQGRNYVSTVVSQQVGQANVNGTKLKAFPIVVPLVEEQLRRVTEHERVVEAGRALRIEITRAKYRAGALRRALLAAAFSGKLTG